MIRKQKLADTLAINVGSSVAEETAPIVPRVADTTIPVQLESHLPINGVTASLSRRTSFTGDDEVAPSIPATSSRTDASAPLIDDAPEKAEATASLGSSTVRKDDKGGVETWSLSTKLNVFFFLIFVVVVSVQWFHNRALANQLGALRADFKSQQALLQQSLTDINKLLGRLIEARK